MSLIAQLFAAFGGLALHLTGRDLEGTILIATSLIILAIREAAQ